MKELIAKIQEEKNKIISERALREKEIELFFSNLRQVDQTLIKHLTQYDIQTAKCVNVFPSLYSEEFDAKAAEMYAEEHRVFVDFAKGIDEVRSRLIAEAEEALNGK